VAAGHQRIWSAAAQQSRGKQMRDTAKHRAEIIEHLEKALTLCDQASEPIVGYLVERALDWRAKGGAPLEKCPLLPQ
jgi:hypothetical protein